MLSALNKKTRVYAFKSKLIQLQFILNLVVLSVSDHMLTPRIVLSYYEWFVKSPNFFIILNCSSFNCNWNEYYFSHILKEDYRLQILYSWCFNTNNVYEIQTEIILISE